LVSQIQKTFNKNYFNNTPNKIFLIDLYLVYVVLTGLIQVVYAVLVGSFPFNSFVSGVLSTVGCFSLTVSLRMQMNPENVKQGIYRPERAIADWIFCNVILHLVVLSFIG